ncbi:hypothetical protein BGZ46_000513, partial [Entomortierella lignicola]
GDLVQIIPGNNIRCLYHLANSPGGIHVVMTDEEGEFQTIAQLCRESEVATLLGKSEEDDVPPPYISSSSIVEEDEDTYEDEKANAMMEDEEDESGSYSPTESAYHPSGLNKVVHRLTLDFGEGFDIGSHSPDSPQSFQEILDIGSGPAHSGGSSSSLLLKDEDNSPTYI